MDGTTPKTRFAEFNLDPALAEAVESASRQQIIEGILRLDDPRQIPPKFTLVSQFIRICTGRFLASDAWTIRLHPNVLSLKAARPMGIYECCKHPPQAGDSEEIIQGTLRPLRFTGRGCIVAALDFGLDFTHPNFLNSDGTTRVTAFWNQVAGYDPAHPNRYGYGRVFSRDEINRALSTPNSYEALGYHPAISDTGHGSHGTHTLDIAAGNGRARGSIPGVAPDADLLFVHLSTPNPGPTGDLGDSVRMLEALDFVHRTAEDRPWVVNLSVGRTAGSHDGTSPFEQGMHELLRLGSGRAIVQSAGNYRAADLAVEGWLRDGERRDLGWIIDPRDTVPNEIDAWYSGNDRFLVALQPPEGGRFVEVRLGEVADISHDGSLVGRIYHRKNDPNNRDNHIEVFLYPNAPSGAWTLRLIGEYVINGRFHAWIERSLARPGAQSRFDPKITTQSYTLGTIATSPLVITVGAYDAHAEGQPLAPFSSCGPTRDDRHEKPELLAPGVSVLAARSIPRGAARQEGLLIARSGTSMATPHVAGCVATMFEAAGRPVSIQEIRNCLKHAAEPVTDGEDTDCCAWGRLNIAEAIDKIRNSTWPDSLPTPQMDSFDSGDSQTTAWPAVSGAIAEEVAALPGVERVETRSEGRQMVNFDSERFLDRAEQAIEKSSAGRRQSEMYFLQQLLRELDGRVSAPSLSPAALFRAAMKDWLTLQGAQDLLAIVALPSRHPETPLRPGDWMLRVVPGTGDVGHVAILASVELLPLSAFAYGGIAAEGGRPGYYGVVVEGGAFPHTRKESFVRRFLDGRGRVPADTIILRPQTATPDSSEEHMPPALPEEFDPSTVPKEVNDAMSTKDWPRALELAIQAGIRDENDLTDLLFFNRHPELPIGTLDPKNPRIKQLSGEWTTIRDHEARPAIEKAAEDTSLVVSGRYVAERDPQFWGKSGKKFRDLVEWAAGEVDINPGLLGAVLLAEWDQSSLYLSADEVVSFLSGTDDFFEEKAQLAANVPAFSKVHFDIAKKMTNTNEHGRTVTTIPFNSGRDAALATAVYLKYGEIKLRKGAKKNGGDFDKLPAETQFALVRIAMAAGHGGIDSDGTLIRFKWKDKKWVPARKGETGGVLLGVASRLEAVLAGKDILVRRNEDRGDPTLSAHITDRNATILTAQALHLSDWMFGKPLAAAPHSTVQEDWSEAQEPAWDKFTPPASAGPAEDNSPEQPDDKGTYNGLAMALPKQPSRCTGVLTFYERPNFALFLDDVKKVIRTCVQEGRENELLDNNQSLVAAWNEMLLQPVSMDLEKGRKIEVVPQYDWERTSGPPFWRTTRITFLVQRKKTPAPPIPQFELPDVKQDKPKPPVPRPTDPCLDGTKDCKPTQTTPPQEFEERFYCTEAGVKSIKVKKGQTPPPQADALSGFYPTRLAATLDCFKYQKNIVDPPPGGSTSTSGGQVVRSLKAVLPMFLFFGSVAFLGEADFLMESMIEVYELRDALKALYPGEEFLFELNKDRLRNKLSVNVIRNGIPQDLQTFIDNLKRSGTIGQNEYEQLKSLANDVEIKMQDLDGARSLSFARQRGTRVRGQFIEDIYIDEKLRPRGYVGLPEWFEGYDAYKEGARFDPPALKGGQYVTTFYDPDLISIKSYEPEGGLKNIDLKYLDEQSDKWLEKMKGRVFEKGKVKIVLSTGPQNSVVVPKKEIHLVVLGDDDITEFRDKIQAVAQLATRKKFTIKLIQYAKSTAKFTSLL